MMEQAAILSHRLDTLVSEAERLESGLLAEGQDVTARDVACFVLELRLARRSLNALLPAFDPPPLRSLTMVRDREQTLAAPRSGPA